MQRDGMVDIVHTTNAYYVSEVPEVDAMKLSDFKPWEERGNGAWAYFNDLHEKKGLYLLGRIGIDTPFYLYLTRPIKTADLKGVQISAYLPCTFRLSRVSAGIRLSFRLRTFTRHSKER